MGWLMIYLGPKSLGLQFDIGVLILILEYCTGASMADLFMGFGAFLKPSILR